VFFQNSVGCGAAVGHEAPLGKLFRLTPGPTPDSWLLPRGSGAGRKTYRRCANLETAAACHWLIGDDQRLCISCRLNRTILIYLFLTTPSIGGASKWPSGG